MKKMSKVIFPIVKNKVEKTKHNGSPNSIEMKYSIYR